MLVNLKSQNMHLKFKNLLEMVAKLRAPDGCPWDREQTIESMKKHMLEEAQELAEAIEKGDVTDIEEELGDVFLNVLMMAQIAEEEGKFDAGTMMEKIAEKLITRHTWVFGTDEASTPEEAVQLWLKNKAKEKANKAKK
jgi:tetrapyrrole methylase family protein/MazG family protein